MKVTINEQLARAAKEQNSFSDYQDGSATARYNDLCAEFRREVKRLIDAHPKNATPEVLDLCVYYSDKYEQKLAEAINRENRIEASCPSIMIAGGSNFPVRKKEKQNNARERFWAECGDLYKPTTCYYFKKIQNALTNKTIYSSDDCAIEKLKNKLAEIKEEHEKHIAANAYFRKEKTMKGFETLTDEEAERIDKAIKNSYSWEQQPYASYKLTSETTEMRRIEKRIKDIEAMKQRAETEDDDKYETVDGIEVKENAEVMRIQLYFDGKPSEDVRDLLKSNGFRWSPKFGAWQRQLNQHGIYATKQVLQQIKNL
jgi:hypothetical protein